MANTNSKADEKYLLKNGRVLLKEMFDGLAYSYPVFDVYPESRIVGLKLVSIYNLYYNFIAIFTIHIEYNYKIFLEIRKTGLFTWWGWIWTRTISIW